MTRAELLALAARVEAAAGADGELDRLIQEARGFCTHRKSTRYVCQNDSGFTCDTCGVDLYGNRSWPRFTASLDAAASLVPAGMPVSASGWGKNYAHFTIQTGWNEWRHGRAATPALALTAAALRAMAEELP